MNKMIFNHFIFNALYVYILFSKRPLVNIQILFWYAQNNTLRISISISAKEENKNLCKTTPEHQGTGAVMYD